MLSAKRNRNDFFESTEHARRGSNKKRNEVKGRTRPPTEVDDGARKTSSANRATKFGVAHLITTGVSALQRSKSDVRGAFPSRHTVILAKCTRSRAATSNTEFVANGLRENEIGEN